MKGIYSGESSEHLWETKRVKWLDFQSDSPKGNY